MNKRRKSNRIEPWPESATYFTYDFSKRDQKEEAHPESHPPILSAESLEKVFEGATGFHLFEASRGAFLATAEEASALYKARKVIATVAGAISGYYLGRLLTARRPVPCDAPALVSKLRDSSSTFSLRVRREFFKRRIEGLILLVDGKPLRVVDVQDRIAPPPERDPFFGITPDMASLLVQLSWLRATFARTNYTPTPDEYEMAWLVPDFVAARLSYHPNFFASRFPRAQKFEFAYDGPFDPGDTVASFQHTSILSWGFIRFVLLLCVLAAALFLTVLGVQLYVEYRRKPKRTVLLP